MRHTYLLANWNTQCFDMFNYPKNILICEPTKVKHRVSVLLSGESLFASYKLCKLYINIMCTQQTCVRKRYNNSNCNSNYFNIFLENGRCYNNALQSGWVSQLPIKTFELMVLKDVLFKVVAKGWTSRRMGGSRKKC